MSTNILSAKDVNANMAAAQAQGNHGDVKKADVKSMDYHRQVLQNKIAEEKYNATNLKLQPCITDVGFAIRDNTQYISPSDNIQSPCTAKLNAFRNKQLGKYVGLSVPLIDVNIY